MRALTLLLLLCSTVVHAATIDPRVAKHDTCGRYELFSINGIMTDPLGAAANLDRIKVVYGNAYKEHLIRYVVAYNQTRGLKTDFLDSARQVISGYAGATWDKWMNAVTFGVYSLFLDAATSAAIAKKVTELYGFTRPSPYQDEDLNSILKDILGGTAGNGRRLLFGHSQGNLYMNLVYDKMLAAGLTPHTIGVVGLAVPFSSLRTGDVYTTSSNDVVIDAVRVATLNNVLSPTIAIPYAPTVDPLGHNLIQTYFANSAARKQINANITAEFGRIKSPTKGVFFPEYPPVTYANVLYAPAFGLEWNGVAWVPIPEYYKYWTVAPYYESQHVIVKPGTYADAKAVALRNGKACYALAVAAIKKQRMSTTNTAWVWVPMGYPNYRGCWDMITGNPLTDYRLGAWWLYGGDSPPEWRIAYDLQTGSVRAEGGVVCGGTT